MGLLIVASIQPRFLTVCLWVYTCGHAVRWQKNIRVYGYLRVNVLAVEVISACRGSHVYSSDTLLAFNIGTLCCTINERWIFSESQTGGDVGVQLPS
jgi:hypothetical protein